MYTSLSSSSDSLRSSPSQTARLRRRRGSVEYARPADHFGALTYSVTEPASGAVGNQVEPELLRPAQTQTGPKAGLRRFDVWSGREPTATSPPDWCPTRSRGAKRRP